MAQTYTADEKQISFIIPVYNSQKYLQQCIDSLVQLPLSQVEFIFVDDGSTDKSGEILLNYGMLDRRIQLYYQENAGVSSARNLGISKAKGKYLFFLDADDYLDPACYSLLERRTEEGYDLVAFTYTDLFEDGSFMRETIPYMTADSTSTNDLLKLSVASSWLNTCWGRLILRELVVRNQIKFPVSMKTGEDAVFMLSCVQKTKSCLIENFSVLYYRHHAESAMKSTDFQYKMSDLNQLYLARRNIVDQYNDELLRALFYRNFFSVLTNLCFTIVQKRKECNGRTGLMYIYNWSGTQEVLSNLTAHDIRPVYKKIEYRLFKYRSIRLLTAYFCVKQLF